jgi:transposase
MKYNSQYFSQHVIPDIQQSVCSSSIRKPLKRMLLHLDNALARNSRRASEEIESPKAQRLLHPPYSPDRAPSDFVLFGYLKEKLRGTSFTTSNDLIFAIGQLFSEIPEIELKNVFTNWITRLSWVMRKGGEYDTKYLKKNQIIFTG